MDRKFSLRGFAARWGRTDPAVLLPLGIAILMLVAWLAFRPTSLPPRDSSEAIAAEESDTSADGEDRAASADSQVAAVSYQQDAKVNDLPIVEIKTTEGTIRAKLFAKRAPKTTQNFIDLVEKKYYDGIIFHRVIKDFMLQTGDPTGTGRGGRTDKGLPAKRLQDEFHPELRHDKPGILSMANAGPNTGDTQFFITTVPTKWLDDKHAVFGEVISGMDVVQKIENTKTGAQDRPLEPPKMLEVRMVKPEKDAEGKSS